MRATAPVLAILVGGSCLAAAREPSELRDLVSPAPGRIELAVEYPPDGAVVNGSACGVFVAGRALAVQGEKPLLDVAIVFDTSRSTSEPTGVDLDADGVLGKPEVVREGPIFVERISDPDDSVLAAEVAAARLLLDGLDPERTRLAVVTFAGEATDPARPSASESAESATTVVSLTPAHERADAALERTLRREPSGGTDMAAGLDRARRELEGRADREKVVVFFTDGQPTLPHGPDKERENILAVFDAADRAARAGIRIHSFAIGADALEGPLAAVEMAARSGGSFTAVSDPAALPQLMGDLHFTSLGDVTLRNATTGVPAEIFRLAADGSWIGFLPMVPGTNRVEVLARGEGGANAARELVVQLDPDRPPPELLPRYLVQRNELLKMCLEQKRRLRVALEERQRKQLELELDRTRKELRLEIERARAKARERAAAQRKELRLEIAEDPRS